MRQQVGEVCQLLRQPGLFHVEGFHLPLQAYPFTVFGFPAGGGLGQGFVGLLHEAVQLRKSLLLGLQGLAHLFPPLGQLLPLLGQGTLLDRELLLLLLELEGSGRDPAAVAEAKPLSLAPSTVGQEHHQKGILRQRRGLVAVLGGGKGRQERGEPSPLFGRCAGLLQEVAVWPRPLRVPHRHL
ncbi:MAG: hypothetical protein RMI39_04940 [Thermoanaerobaculum sp.]|nr:hypothetical protein [Thermoanaerobaculum sp.]